METDGDVHVRPVYLAGDRYTGDFALQPLFELPGIQRHHDELGNFYLATGDGRIRLGFIPEQDWDTLWQIAVAPAPFAEPRWTASFSEATPTEIVTAVTTELARMYRPEDDTWLTERTAGPAEWTAPYTTVGWTQDPRDRGRLTLTSPDGHITAVHSWSPLSPSEAEQAGQDGRYTLSTRSNTGWYGRFSSRTPARILAAATTTILDPAPVIRYRSELRHLSRHSATITPILPPPPSPLDVQRTAARIRSTSPTTRAAAPATSTSARLAWTSTTPTGRHR
ncbi:hypothetical protein KNE206_53670 [Kitasatospora sp. NE20-6]|uniref:DUF317 domain-containing protein n=1 Tax=Kitasatospora sp. NE20-6 TaxID=2859066 RepID=UPI0034DC3C85